MNKDKRKNLEEIIKLANKTDKQISKMNYKKSKRFIKQRTHYVN